MTGALLGLLAAAGAVLLGARLPARRSPRLTHRLAPYLPAERAAPPTHSLAVTAPTSPRDARSTVGPGSGPVGRSEWAELADRVVGALDRVSGGSGAVRRRLDEVGDGRSVRDFRVEQVRWAVVAAVAVAGPALVSGRFGVAAIGAAAGGLAGALVPDRLLSRAVRRRRAAVLAEFPVVAELLALAVTAGEGPVGALDRVCRLTGGVLADDLAGALARVRAGAPLAVALEELRDRVGVLVLARFVDGVLVALERGTPLADVLRAQAADVRDAGRRALIEDGGRRELGMLVPVVFGVLPTTVVFALFPALAAVSALTGG